MAPWTRRGCLLLYLVLWAWLSPCKGGHRRAADQPPSQASTVAIIDLFSQKRQNDSASDSRNAAVYDIASPVVWPPLPTAAPGFEVPIFGSGSRPPALIVYSQPEIQAPADGLQIKPHNEILRSSNIQQDQEGQPEQAPRPDPYGPVAYPPDPYAPNPFGPAGNYQPGYPAPNYPNSGPPTPDGTPRTPLIFKEPFHSTPASTEPPFIAFTNSGRPLPNTSLLPEEPRIPLFTPSSRSETPKQVIRVLTTPFGVAWRQGRFFINQFGTTPRPATSGFDIPDHTTPNTLPISPVSRESAATETTPLGTNTGQTQVSSIGTEATASTFVPTETPRTAIRVKETDSSTLATKFGTERPSSMPPVVVFTEKTSSQKSKPSTLSSTLTTRLANIFIFTEPTASSSTAATPRNVVTLPSEIVDTIPPSASSLSTPTVSLATESIPRIQNSIPTQPIDLITPLPSTPPKTETAIPTTPLTIPSSPPTIPLSKILEPTSPQTIPSSPIFPNSFPSTIPQFHLASANPITPISTEQISTITIETHFPTITQLSTPTSQETTSAESASSETSQIVPNVSVRSKPFQHIKKPESPAPNRIRGKPHILCMANGIMFIAESYYKFDGTISARGRENRTNCSYDSYRNLAEINDRSINVSFPYYDCGEPIIAKKGDHMFQTDVVVSFRDGRVQTFLARCVSQKLRYDVDELPRKIEEALEELNITPTKIESQAPMPMCTMRVVQETEQQKHKYGPSNASIINDAFIGQQLRMEFSLNPPSAAFGFLIRNCTVWDSIIDTRYVIIDDKGCSVDINIFAHPHYDTYHDLAIVHWHAFKVPDSAALSFRCDCVVCTDVVDDETGQTSCEQIPTPPICPDVVTSSTLQNALIFDSSQNTVKKKKRREAIDQNVRAGFCLSADGSQTNCTIDSSEIDPSDQSAMCFSKLIMALSLGFNSTLLMTAISVFCICAHRKSKADPPQDQDTNRHPIESGPQSGPVPNQGRGIPVPNQDRGIPNRPSTHDSCECAYLVAMQSEG